MSARLVLVLGGARSGKSAFAQSLAERAGGGVCFVATAEDGDEEMRRRIRRHRANRPKEWETVELEGGIRLGKPPTPGRVVLLDCLTLYLSNLMAVRGLDRTDESGASIPEEELERREREVVEEALSLVERLRRRSRLLIVVSNEVGMGLVPPFPSGRLFRDLAGRLHQRLAEEAEEVYLVVAGLPLCLKDGENPLSGERHGGLKRTVDLIGARRQTDGKTEKDAGEGPGAG